MFEAPWPPNAEWPGAGWPSALVRRPGLQSTVQDRGRQVRALGVPGGGAADPTSLRLANALVGNPAGAAALEVTLQGPELEFGAPALVAVCGAPFALTLDGEARPLHRAFPVRAGQRLGVGGTARGVRAVLAIRGGLCGEEAFGSRATDLRSSFGGLGGRALRAGDRLSWKATGSAAAPPLFLHPDLPTPTGPRHVLRVLPTPDATPALLAALTPALTVGTQVDRVGVRLVGALPAVAEPARISLPTVPGLVQLPPDGNPILLLPDSGTHGGYPTPLAVIRADLPRLGQLRPGDRVFLRVVNAAQAHAALLAHERPLRLAEGALQAWWGGPG